MSDGNKKTPATVKFVGNADDYDKRVTQGKEYYAYFIEFWETERCNLHIKDDSGKIGYWYDLKDFEIMYVFSNRRKWS